MKTLKTEMNDLSSTQLTVVRLSNMFTAKNCEDRRLSVFHTPFLEYMTDLREDVEQQAQEYGKLTGIAVNELEQLVLLRFSNEKEALQCFSSLNGRLFDGRKIQAELIRDESEGTTTTKKKEEEEQDALLSEFFASIAAEEEKFK